MCLRREAAVAAAAAAEQEHEAEAPMVTRPCAFSHTFSLSLSLSPTEQRVKTIFSFASKFQKWIKDKGGTHVRLERVNITLQLEIFLIKLNKH